MLKGPPVKPTIHPIQATFYQPDATMNTSHATLSVRGGEKNDKPVISLIFLYCLSTSMLYYPSIKLVDMRST
jgi:hypothetical protein